MKTVAYSAIKRLAASRADRPVDKLPTGEAALLRNELAEWLPQLWNREAWPELCRGEALALTDHAFDKREGETDEIGDILGVYAGGNPETATAVLALEWTEADGAARVLTDETSVYVEWQLPPPDLLDADYDTAAALDALELPRRLREPLSLYGAAALIESENVVRAAQLRSRAELNLARQASALRPPWWRQRQLRR
jgi:hypothetical protein